MSSKQTFADMLRTLNELEDQKKENPRQRNQGKQVRRQATFKGHSQQAHPMTSRSENSFDRSVDRVIPLVHEKRTSKLSFSSLILVAIVVLLIIYILFK